MSGLDEALDDAEAEQQAQDFAAKAIAAEARASTATIKANAAKREIAALEIQLEQARAELALKQEVGEPPAWLGVPEDTRAHRATLLGLFSDPHIGEVVDPDEMAGYNAFNPEIAEKRVRRFFERAILISRQYLSGVEYDGFVLASLGDTVSGNIHEELNETNGLSNYDAIRTSRPWLRTGIEMLLEEFGSVHVVSVPGNHPRDSRKPRYKKRSEHNADTFLWQLIADDLADEDAATFDIPVGFSADFSIYSTAFRAEHGDEARGGTGTAGALSPLSLRTHRLRKQAQAEGTPFDIALYGHWHQYMSLPAKGFICNGTIKGYDEYARGKGFEPEPPQQGLLVVTPEHGVSVQTPLFVAKRSDEGW